MEGFFISFIPFLRKYVVESILVFAAFLLTVLSFFLFVQTTNQQPQDTEVGQFLRSTEKNKPASLMVEVSGAVTNPGIIKLASFSRLNDAIDAAGGLTEQADKEFFSRNFNLARYITDQEKIHIPSYSDVQNGIYIEREQIIDYRSPQIVQTVQTDDVSDEKLHINSSTADELETLPGIGQATARKIVSNRPYSQIRELVTKKVLSERIFGQIQDYIAL